MIHQEDIRPHPDPLPPEREDRSPRFAPGEMSDGRAIPTADDTESVTAMRTEKLFGIVMMRSLSLGERVGVRASVNTHSIEIGRGTIFYSFGGTFEAAIHSLIGRTLPHSGQDAMAN